MNGHACCPASPLSSSIRLPFALTLACAAVFFTAAAHGDDDSLIAGRVAAPLAELVPFPMVWANASKSVVDLSHFLDAPAGKNGFITTQGPHLVHPNGTAP
jgi:hypothetical protein